ncbi:hypothetical protein ANN_05814 [Periplaneta americana]|uniref:Alpha 1,4-glycosyltransferase domain-containing protein n=1 Tax=Periplaneta americana TaxID=6978 RepID=A0ABQ8TBV1_PERAM|nr:hypothetical protein ANN_05814 [Periplaneta americana]
MFISANLTREYEVGLVVSQRTNRLAPRSPDLTLLDFFLWSYVKDKVYATPVRDLRKRIIEAIESIPGDMLQRAWQEVVHHLDIVTVTAGAHVRDMTPERCRGFAVLPPSAFYPIPWRQWKLYFDESSSAKTMARLKNSLAIHVWNKFSVTMNVTVGSRQPYGLIAQEYCPRVYAHCGPVF